MFNISSFLDKFSKNIKSAELHKEQILEIIEKHTQLKLSPEQIEIKNYIIYTHASQAAKNKLFIYKNIILDDMEKFTPTKVVDIR